jgi:signal transduction histidine kinase
MGKKHLKKYPLFDKVTGRHQLHCRMFWRHPYGIHDLKAGIHWSHGELHRYHKYFRWLRPLALLFHLFMLFLLFKIFGVKYISLFLALFIILIASTQYIFFKRIEKRILAPVDKLIQGVRQIAEGNYDVQVAGYVPNDIGSLIYSFNEMAKKLHESEMTKANYEKNRKELIANISHDLKTPISSIQGYLEALLDGVVSPEKVGLYLKTIYHNTIYTNRLIDDLFLFTKLDMQKLDLKFEVVSIRAFMHDLCEEFRFELEERQCRFIFDDCLDEECLVHIDGKRIHRAIRNIIGNAVKYGPETNLSIMAKLFRQDNKVAMIISDNGSGIPRDKLPYIFERFYRVDQARTKDLMSTGLGLAIAKELIEAHKGCITVTSEEGRGTSFTVMLPIITK